MSESNRVLPVSNLLEQYKSLIPWLRELERIPDEVLQQPIHPGKWSIVEILSHMMFWDRLILDKRLPMLCDGIVLESTDTEEYNQAAARYARSGITVRQIIEECIEVRIVLLQKLTEQKDPAFSIAFMIGNTKVTMEHYLTEMIEHDHHHCQQIKDFLEQNMIHM